MSAKSSAVVVPTKGGSPQPAEAAAVTEMKGGALVLSPLPLSGGRRRKGSRKTKKVPKKILKMFRKGSAKTLRRLMKGGEEAQGVVATESEPAEGGRKRKSRKHRGFLY
jgi:alpha/beta superfamily hydrolase